jgi:3-phosphoshikimate 1-carboxyvinyltransferase
VLAALADGTTVIRGAAELRGKESDRIAVVVHNLRAAGVIAEELADGLTVTGPAQVRDASVATHGDHRIAMSFAVLGVLTGARLEVDQPNVVDVSYPAFWNDLARVTS